MPPRTLRHGSFGAHLRQVSGSALRTSLLLVSLLSVLTLLLFVGVQARTGGPFNSGSKRAASESGAQVSGLAETVSYRWASARAEIARGLKEASHSQSPKEGLDYFLSLRPNWDATFAEVENLTSLTLKKLDAKKQEFADPHIQSLLPPEVLPELAQAINDHKRGVERVQNEVRTLDTQTLPDIESRMRKLAEASRLKEQLSGTVAARQLWQKGIAELAATLGGGPL